MAVDESLIAREINSSERVWIVKLFKKYIVVKRLTASHLMDAVNDILDVYDRIYEVHGSPFNEGPHICQVLVKKNVL